MTRTEFQLPLGNSIENISIDEVRKIMIDEFETYWEKGSGDGSIDFYIDDEKISTLLLEPNKEYGMYLNYTDFRTDREWLSVYDKNNLDNVVETAYEIYVSRGLLLPKELAFEGIKYFLECGEKLSKIEWIQPEEIPEGGNY